MDVPPFNGKDKADGGWLTWGRVARLIGEMGLRDLNARRATPDEDPGGQAWDDLERADFVRWRCVRRGLDIALAAPDLLAACIRITKGLRSPSRGTYEAWLEQALDEAAAAIAKVERTEA